MKRESTEVSNMSDVLARIEAALVRSEIAAARLGRRHRGLRIAARDTLAGLDRLIQTQGRKSNG